MKKKNTSKVKESSDKKVSKPTPKKKVSAAVTKKAAKTLSVVKNKVTPSSPVDKSPPVVTESVINRSVVSRTGVSLRTGPAVISGTEAVRTKIESTAIKTSVMNQFAFTFGMRRQANLNPILGEVYKNLLKEVGRDLVHVTDSIIDTSSSPAVFQKKLSLLWALLGATKDISDGDADEQHSNPVAMGASRLAELVLYSVKGKKVEGFPQRITICNAFKSLSWKDSYESVLAGAKTVSSKDDSNLEKIVLTIISLASILSLELK
jgi:hypothetical protein